MIENQENQKSPITNYEKITTRKVFENILDQIKEMMIKGALAPGDYLPPERELADRFGVSRSSLREALRILEVLDIIRNSPKRGTVVQTANPSKILHILSLTVLTTTVDAMQLIEARETLEKDAAVLGVRRYETNDLQDMETTLQNLFNAKSPSEIHRLDFEFHRQIVSSSQNQIFAELFQMVCSLHSKEMSRLFHSAATEQQFLKQIMDVNQSVYEHMRMRNEEKTRETITEYFYVIKSRTNAL